MEFIDISYEELEKIVIENSKFSYDVLTNLFQKTFDLKDEESYEFCIPDYKFRIKKHINILRDYISETYDVIITNV